MPSISFSTLKDKLLSGEKTQTIRPLRSPYWLKFKKGDRVIGFWKMRTNECEKLFEGTLSEDPFVIKGWAFTHELMVRDGFKDVLDGIQSWFRPHYGDDLFLMNFVVLRWKTTQEEETKKRSY